MPHQLMLPLEPFQKWGLDFVGPFTPATSHIFGCPIEVISGQGGHFLNAVISGLTQHYTVVHKKSMPYYPHANGLAESTNKTLQNILQKIINENRTNWDTKLSSALWAYKTSFKTSLHATSFRLAYG